MSIVNITSNSNEFEMQDFKDVFKHGQAGLDLDESVRKLLSDLNAHANEVSSHELRTRQATYRYVASLVDAAWEFANNEAVRGTMIAFFDTLFGSPKEPETGANPFLRLVRAADGEWLMVTNAKGDVSYRWTPNRSGEKYAAVCRFAIDYGFTGTQLLNLLGGTERISYTLNEKTKEIEPTINAIIAADRERYKVANRAVLDNGDWRKIKSLKPIATLPYTEKLKAAFTLSEGGLGLASIAVVGSQIYILGDAGKEGNEVHRIFKKEYDNLQNTYYKASKLSDDPATLEEALVRDDV